MIWSLACNAELVISISRLCSLVISSNLFSTLASSRLSCVLTASQEYQEVATTNRLTNTSATPARVTGGIYALVSMLLAITMVASMDNKKVIISGIAPPVIAPPCGAAPDNA